MFVNGSPGRRRGGGRDPASVRLVAVSKTFGTDAVKAAMDAGQTLFGENYVQELQSKAAEIGPRVEWHLIGHLQTNKVKKVIGLVLAIQTLDRVELAQEIEKRVAAANITLDCLIEVNLGGEGSKTGAAVDSVVPLVKACASLPHLRLRGLMCVPPFGPPEVTRPYFVRLRDMLPVVRAEAGLGPEFFELSMGMSGDFEAAVAEGATIVRVGTAIFGAR
jgi:pyridoxal phosphate enzyme (YggS family)